MIVSVLLIHAHNSVRPVIFVRPPEEGEIERIFQASLNGRPRRPTDWYTLINDPQTVGDPERLETPSGDWIEWTTLGESQRRETVRTEARNLAVKHAAAVMGIVCDAPTALMTEIVNHPRDTPAV